MAQQARKDVSEWLEQEPAKSSWDVEYPEMDREYVDSYPIDFEKINPDDIVNRPDHSMYVHIPFCRSMCSFCEFNHVHFEEETIERYVEALKNEMTFYAETTDIPDRNISSIFFGGGTSTALSTEQYCEVIDHLVESYDIDVSTTEITVESHPESTDRAEMETLNSKGVNRITFGIQSFHDELLSNLGRTRQNGDGNVQALKEAKDVGFEKVNIDLMYRLPDQDLEMWEQDLDKALELGVDGFSLYSFHIIPGTPYANNAPEQPDEETDIAMYYFGIDKLMDEGFNHTMKPDLHKPGKESQYVIDCWKAPQKHLIGFGAGAYSKQVNDYTYGNVHNVDEYIELLLNDKVPVFIGQKINAKEMMSRYMVLGSRALHVEKAPFEEQFGFQITDIFGDAIDRLKDQGLMEESADAFEVTREGKIYIDNICKAFYSEECEGMAQPLGTHLQNYTRDHFMDFEEFSAF